MLGGLDPILLFQFYDLSPADKAKMKKYVFWAPGDDDKTLIPFAPVPLYLSEQLTGVFVQDESKEIVVATSQDTKTDGSGSTASQKGLYNTLKVNLVANKDSIGLMLFFAMADKIFEWVTSNQYKVTYLNGSMTVFGGLIEEISIKQQAGSTRYDIGVTFTTKKPETKEPKSTPTLGSAAKPAVLE